MTSKRPLLSRATQTTARNRPTYFRNSGPLIWRQPVFSAIDATERATGVSSILVHGDCALVFGDMRGEVRIDGQMRALNNKALSVWVRENERWVLLAFQPTKYPA